jgi:hypothetical protein
MYFDGVDDTVVLPVNYAVKSISAFINFNLVPSTQYFLGYFTVLSGVRYNGSSFLVYGDSASGSELLWTKENRIVHFACVQNGNDWNIYIDSSFIGSSNNAGNLSLIRTIGSRYYGRAGQFFFKGNIGLLKLYDRALNVNEIKLLSQGLPISRVGLLGEWKMNEMSGTTAYDTSGNGNHGTIVGATYSTDKPF